MLTLPRFSFQLCILFALRFNAGINRRNYKSTLKRRQIDEFGWLPAELLQAVMRIVGLRVTIQNQFFASSTSSLSFLKPLTLKTSVT